MNIFMNYNFFADRNALDPFITNITSLSDTKIENGYFNHFNVSSDVTSSYSTVIPSEWTLDTLLDCNFNDNINAGSIASITSSVTSIKVKRRKYGEYNWTTIKEVPIQTIDDFRFAFPDYLTTSGTTYEYAFVPVMEGVEGTYATNMVTAKFNGVFICDANTAYRFFSGVSYGTNTRMQKVGTFEPFGRQYPVVVANGMVNYETGSITGDIYPSEVYTTGEINREAIVKDKQALMKFLTNKKAKVLKDWNGQSWLVFITASPSVDYNSSYGMGTMSMSADWTEIGDIDNKVDLYNAGLISDAD